MLDAGDIIQTLSGWAVIGYGTAIIPRFQFHFEEKLDFRQTSTKTQRGIQAMDEAISELTLRCNPTDARKALYLLTAPSDEMDMDLIKGLSASLKSMATEVVIRSGDYPSVKGSLNVTIILSELIGSRKVMDYFTKTISYISSAKTRRGGIEYGYR